MVGVAFSGGLDSTALLRATVARAATLGIRTVALHVHHGLNANADAWAQHAQALCERWAARGRPVSFRMQRLCGRPAAGESVEAWARAGRYAALRDMAVEAGSDLVLLAHHRRDQAETFLLQALRGAGPSGLAAMPRSAVSEGVTWARPWLDAPRSAIVGYARRHRLAHVEDDSNDDPRYARNRLRIDVWPALETAFPDAEATLATAARLAGDARSVLEATTADDLRGVADATSRTLDLTVWRALTPARRRLVLVAWLRVCIGRPAPRTLVDRLAVELGQPDATCWPAPGGALRRRRHLLSYEAGSNVARR